MTYNPRFIKKQHLTLIIVTIISIIGTQISVTTGQNDNDGTTSVWIEPSAQSITQGKNFCVSIYIDSGGKSIRTAGIQLTYPAPDLQFIELIDHDLLGTAVLPVGGNIATGLINYAVARQANVNPPSPLENRFITICFSTINASKSLYPLTFIQVDLIDENGEAITDIEIGNGQIDITTGKNPLRATCSATPPGIHPVIDTPILFTSEVTGGEPPYTYYWEFGDGSTSNEKNLTYTYTRTGTFSVNYTVTDLDTDYFECSLLVTVSSYGNTLPNADITYPAIYDTLSGIVNITGTATDRDGSIKKIEIKIDDLEWKIAKGSNNWYYHWDTSEVDDGNHTITVRAYDDKDYSHPLSIPLEINNHENTGGQTPGFPAFLGIMGLGLIYLLQRKKKEE